MDREVPLGERELQRKGEVAPGDGDDRGEMIERVVGALLENEEEE